MIKVILLLPLCYIVSCASLESDLGIMPRSRAGIILIHFNLSKQITYKLHSARLIIRYVYCYLLELAVWTLVSTNSECSGSETQKTLVANSEIKDCADACNGVSSMFIYSKIHNKCYCETSASPDGTCNVKSMSGYNLFRYNKGRSTII